MVLLTSGGLRRAGMAGQYQLRAVRYLQSHDEIVQRPTCTGAKLSEELKQLQCLRLWAVVHVSR